MKTNQTELLAALKALIWQHDNNNGTLCGMALQDARVAVERAEGGDPAVTEQGDE